MSYFKAKMHQIRPRPRWGSSQRSPRPPSWIWGVLLLREGKGMGGKGREGEGEEKEERGKEGKGEGREGKGRGEFCVIAFGGWTPLPLSSHISIIIIAVQYCTFNYSASRRQLQRVLRVPLQFLAQHKNNIFLYIKATMGRLNTCPNSSGCGTPFCLVRCITEIYPWVHWHPLLHGKSAPMRITPILCNLY